jgi:tyrocidine synthetase-3
VTISIDDNFFELGGHSLKATVMVSRIHKVLNVRLTLAQVFKTPTIRGLSGYIKRAARDKYAAIEPVEKQEYYALSSAQKRLYILQQMEQDSTAYNMPSVIPLSEEPDINQLKEIFIQLIHRHESFRTSFHMIADQPVQKVHDHMAFSIEYYDTEGTRGKRQTTEDRRQKTGDRGQKTGDRSDTYLSSEFICSFDLTQAPLLRVAVIKLAESRCFLMVDMHHIISDGISHEILAKDCMTLISGNTLLPLRIQYKDFSRWQNSAEVKAIIQQQEAYWLKEFKGEISVLNLPTDFTRPGVQNFAGNSVHFELCKEHTRVLKSIAKEENATLYMVLLALFNILLSKLSSQEDIVIGTPAAGRRHVDLQNIIGMFVNTLALRNYPSGEKTVKEFFQEVNEQTWHAFENQDYPFEDLVEILSVKRDASRNPLFDIMLALQNVHHGRAASAGLANQPPAVETSPSPLTNAESETYEYNYESGIAKFDLSVTAWEIGETVYFSFNYCTALFKRETIERFIGYFKKIISELLENFEKKLWQIDIIGEEEKNQLLYAFNAAKSDYRTDKTIPGLFAEEVEKRPDHVALIGKNPKHKAPFGQINACGEGYLSYRELGKKSSQLAYLLHEKGVGPDIIVGIMMQRSIDMIIAVLGILKAGGAYLPIEPNCPKERLNYMLADSKVKYLVKKDNSFMDSPGGQKLFVLDFVQSDFKFVSNFEIRILDLNTTNLSYVIYTSGTTGNPKGVVIQHGSVVNIITSLFHHYPFSREDTYLFKTPYVFDVSISELFGWFLGGGRLAILEEEAEKDPQKICDAVERMAVSHINFVPSMFNVFVHGLTPKTIRKLSPLKYIFLAGEVLSPLVVNQFRELNSSILLENLYGPTEGTIYASSYSLVDGKGVSPIPIGKPLENIKLYVMNTYGNLQPVGVPGELCIGGVGVARGYLNRPELTAERFCLRWPGGLAPLLYRSGDLCRWLADGNIEFLGRMDHQVKIRGYRVELGEIENQLLRHDAVNEAVVLTREEGDDKYLCAYIVGEFAFKGANVSSELKRYLSQSLPDYMIPTYVTELPELPLTASGKIDRQVLPAPVGQRHGVYAEPRDSIEMRLVRIWEEVLFGRDSWQPQPSRQQVSIGIDDNFFELGGHSLKATIMTAKIHKELNVIVPLGELFKKPTIRRLSGYIKGAAEDRYAAIAPVEKKEYYVLSSAQKRLYILQQMEQNSTAYNMPSVIPIAEEFDIKELENMLIQLIHRHESFRTSFHMVASKPVQKVHDSVAFSIGPATDGSQPTAALISSLIRPFDLTQAPLLRVGLIKPTDGSRVLVVDMHHLISDGISHEILARDFMTLISGETLLPLRIQYKDFSRWQNSKTVKQTLKQQQDYWLKAFQGEIPVLNLPTDYPRPPLQSFAGDSLTFELPVHHTRALKTMALEINATLYMVLLAMFNVLLSRLSSQEDIIIGTPIAGRRHPDLEKIIGMFVNTLALRNYPIGEKPFAEFLHELQQRTLKAFENQEYPFEELVEKAAVERDTARNPLFDVMFVFQAPGDPGDDYLGEEKHILADTTDLEPETYGEVTRTAKFDLTLTALAVGEKLVFTVNHCTRLFKPETISRFIAYFNKIVSLLTMEPDLKLSDVEIITDKEKEQILYNFNNTGREYPRDNTIQQLFEQQAQTSPDRTAVIFHDKAFTYEMLNQSSNQLAKRLRKKGVKKETIVGLLLERSLEMIVSILGVLKAGSAYLPLDPQYPLERMRVILKDSNAHLLLTQDEWCSKIKFEREIVIVNDQEIYSGESSNLSSTTSPQDVAYIIYTSGSTGLPRGVIIEHVSVVNLVVYQYQWFGITGRDRILQFSSISFDASVEQIFVAFYSGAGLVLVDREILLDANRFEEYVLNHSVTHIHAVPSFLTTINNQQYKALKRIVAGGDICPPALAAKWSTACKFYNEYGPTETTVTSIELSVDEVAESKTQLPIGKPVANTTVYILDRWQQPVPLAVTGELYIGGDGVARGYLNNPQQTHDNFQDNPFLKGERFYRTGDLCRWLINGNVEFLGRIDQQVKIRGFRIELREIESQLSKYDAIKDAVVVARGTSKGEKYLCAYVVARPKPGDAAVHLADTLDSSALRDYLSEILPSYMIPSYFEFIEKIPLSPNGKVDRKALPEPEMAAGEKYTAPGDEIETKLVEIWSDILTVKKEKIGIDANFFHLGGHSLKAVIMASRSHKELKVNIPLSEVFKNSTIRGLAEYIRYKKGVVTGEYTTNNRLSLVKLKASGNLEPFFCIHAATGLITPYRELARLLDKNRPLYALQHPGLDGNCEPYTDIESMAAYYADIIRDIQPVGPYFIGGWSFGGNVALEIAQKLIHKGQQVQLLVLIDSAVPPVFAYEDNAAMLSHLASIFTKSLMVDLNVSTRNLREISPENRTNYFLGQLKEALKGKKAKERRISQLKNIVQVYQVCSNALRMYEPQKYPGQILLFRAGDVNEALPASLFDWSPMSPIPVITRKIPGSHFTIMEKPNIQVLARELNQYLRLK